jgi:PPOX class probable F420-dependent enzyme
VIKPEVLALLKSGRVATLGTIASNGSPHLVPIVFAFDETVLVTAVDTKPKRSTRLARLANIRQEPRVSVLVHNYSEAWRELWWVRVDGTAAIHEQGDAFDRALEALRARYPQYEQTRIEGPVVRITLERVTVWQAMPS